MKSALRLLASSLPAFLAFSPAASAHPGHEGHELTWDLDHLAAHPFATILCLIVAGLGAWVVARSLAAWRKTSRARF